MGCGASGAGAAKTSQDKPMNTMSEGQSSESPIVSKQERVNSTTGILPLSTMPEKLSAEAPGDGKQERVVSTIDKPGNLPTSGIIIILLQKSFGGDEEPSAIGVEPGITLIELSKVVSKVHPPAFGCAWSLVMGSEKLQVKNGMTLLDHGIKDGTILQLIQQKCESSYVVTCSEPQGSTSSTTTAEIWDISTGACVHTLRPNGGFQIINPYDMRIEFSPDGSLVVWGCLDGEVCIFDALTGTLAQTLHPMDAASRSGLEFQGISSDGKMVLTKQAELVVIWDILSGENIQTLSGHADCIVSSATFSKDSKLVVTSGGGDRTARIWNRFTGLCVHVLKMDEDVICAQFSDDGSLVVTGIESGAKIWDTSTGACVHTLLCDSNVWSAAFSSDASWVITADSGEKVKLWNCSSGECVQIFEQLYENGEILPPAFSPDGSLLIVSVLKHKIQLWDTSSWESKGFIEHKPKINSMTFSFDGSKVLTSSADGTAKIFDTSTCTDDLCRCIQSFQARASGLLAANFSMN